MDIHQPCHLCPRRLYQSGKRCTDSFTVTKTACAHYFHPACWERYNKKSKTTSDACCPCPICNRIVTRDGLTEIIVSRDKSLREEPLQENQLRSAAEESRLRRAAAELEKRSREKQQPGREGLKKVRTRKRRAMNFSSPSRPDLLPRIMKIVAIALVALAFLALLGKCYWDHFVIERFTTWEDAAIDQTTVINRMVEINEQYEMLMNMTFQEKVSYYKVDIRLLCAEEDRVLSQLENEYRILKARLEQRDREIARLKKWGMDKWQNPAKLAAFHVQNSKTRKRLGRHLNSPLGEV